MISKILIGMLAFIGIVHASVTSEPRTSDEHVEARHVLLMENGLVSLTRFHIITVRIRGGELLEKIIKLEQHYSNSIVF